MKLKLHLARLSLLRWGITASPLREGRYVDTIGGESIELSHSGFNVKWMQQLGIEAKTIVELGAYDGGDALRFSKQLPNCRVVTVEADPVRVKTVRHHLRDTHAQVIHAAVCDTDGPVDWFASSVNGEMNAQGSMYQHSDHYREKFPFVEQEATATSVNGIRFENMCAEHDIAEIDFLHMDIEGAEYVALNSIGSIRPKLIFLEMLNDYFVDSANVKQLEDLLIEFDYKLVAKLSQDRLYIHSSQTKTK